VRTFLVAVVLGIAATAVASAAPLLPGLVPQPRAVHRVPCPGPLALDRPLRFPSVVDAGGFELLRERWKALGIPEPRLVADGSFDVALQNLPDTVPPPPEKYSLLVDGAVHVFAPANEARFDAIATLAQLPVRDNGRWVLPCVAVDDVPAMRWRIVSDDVSRGPFPTMSYAKERIRTLASLKINGWSPYMENVAADPRYPFVAWPNGFTAAQLRELTAYARRFSVTLIPEQQTFAHMHETLKWEQLAPLAELPHGYLVSESDPRTYAYLGPLIREVLDATKPVPFFHLGSDEPIDLGRGRTPRTAQVYADHVKRAASFLAGSGARPMIWDDAIQQDKSILGLIPRDTVIVTWHYGAEASFKPYMNAIASAGFQQFAAPGASNWTEIYPDLTNAYTNVGRMLADGKDLRGSGVLGMFMTVWHDDGETLYEATWPPLAYAAASAWQSGPVDTATWHAAYARAFFGTDDPRYARDLDALQQIRDLLRTKPSDPVDYLFWSDPFAARLQARAQTLDLAGIRDRAETVMTDLWDAQPPLHRDAAAVMKLAAMRYDQLARRMQIGREVHDYYDDARAHAGKPGQSQVYRSLGVAKYLCWEMRDALANLVPLYERAWRYENTEPGLAHVLVRYQLAESDAQRCADRIDGVMREDYLRHDTVPPWDQVMPSASAQATVTPSAR
jgi:hexosaminidase